MLTLADLLEQLRARGLDADILRLVEAKLTPKSATPNRYGKFVTDELPSIRQEERIQGNDTDQKRRIRQAIADIWPNQIPKKIGRKARVDLIHEHLKEVGLLPVSTSTIERELGYRKRKPASN